MQSLPDLQALLDRLTRERDAVIDVMRLLREDGAQRFGVAFEGAKRTLTNKIASSKQKPPRFGSLKEKLLMLLRSEYDSAAVSKLTTEVERRGYKTKNKTLAKSVGIALAEMVKSGHVVKVSRGVFKAAR